MHSGPTPIRDTEEEWKQEIEECIDFLETNEVGLDEYLGWLNQRHTKEEN